MDIKVKVFLIVSLSALFVAGCSTTDTNGRYAFGQQAADPDKKGLTHTHNGVAHTHPLPEGGLSHSHNYNPGNAMSTNPKTCAPCRAGTTRVVTIPPAQGGGSQNSANSHSHNGRRHSHPLPASGTNHTHNQTQQQQDTVRYDYGSSTSAGNNYNYYNGGSKGVAHSHGAKSHTHVLPASGNSHSHNQGSTSIGAGFTDFANGGGAGGCDTASGNYYVVKKSEGIYRAAVNSGVKQADVIRLNNLPIGSTIHPGQCLRVR
ncbi:MAG: LysM domain-containing protein [Thiotrichaceae bacterium]